MRILTSKSVLFIILLFPGMLFSQQFRLIRKPLYSIDGTRCSEYELVYNKKKELINHLLNKYPDTISTNILGYYYWKQFKSLKIKAIRKIWIMNYNEIEETKPQYDLAPIKKKDKLTIALIIEIHGKKLPVNS
jgi:hypothetical protein